MRLKLNYEKVKTYIFMLFITFVVPFTCLCGLYVKGFCASSNSFPLPYGAGSHYGYGDFPLTENIVKNVNDYLSSQGITSNALVINEIANDNSYISFYYITSNLVFAINNEGYFPILNGNVVIFARSDFYGNFCTGGIITYVPSSNSFSLTSDSYIDGRIDLRYLLVDGSVPSDTVIRYYPVYYSSNGDISGYGWVNNTLEYDLPAFSFDGDSSSGASDDFDGSASGSLVPDGDGGFDLDININIPDYSEKLDDIGGSVDSINDKLDSNNSWLQSIYNSIDNFFSIPSSQEVTDTLGNYPLIQDLSGTVSDTKSAVNSIFDFSSVSPKSVNDVDFDYDFHWKFFDFSSGGFIDKVTTIRIRFSWFESIRTPVETVMIVFMTLGFIVYIFRQIPNLINGVSGGVSAGESISSHLQSSKGGVRK